MSFYFHIRPVDPSLQVYKDWMQSRESCRTLYYSESHDRGERPQGTSHEHR
jgi:hypothetical protein